MEFAELKKTRIDLFLFILSSVVFGLVIVVLEWSIDQLIPTSLNAEIILVISLILLGIMGLIAFFLITPRIEFSKPVYSSFILDHATQTPYNNYNFSYDFWTNVEIGFSDLLSVNENFFDDVTPQQVDLNNLNIKTLVNYTLILWIQNISMRVIFVSNKLRVPPIPKILMNPTIKQKTLHSEFYSNGIEDVYLKDLIRAKKMHLQLPRNLNIKFTNNGLELSKRYFKIAVSYQLYQISKGIDRRITTLGSENDNFDNCYSYSILFTYHAKLSQLYWILSRSHKYWDFALDLYENLKIKYDYSEWLDDLEKLLVWDHLIK